MAHNQKEEPLVERERIEPEVAEAGLEGQWPPKWMTTYTDLTTLLMTFFVLWYALTMMKIPQELWRIREEDEEKIIRGEEEEIDRSPTNIAEDTLIWRQIEKMTPEEKMKLSEVESLREKSRDIEDYLKQEHGEIAGGVKFKELGEDVVIVPAAPLLFSEGSDKIKSSFYPILDKLAGLLQETKATVRIEGHTDDTPIHPRHRLRFPSNWELSAARAISVARYFIDQHRIPPERIAVAGYGPSLPRHPNDDPEKKAQNRRVEFHISVSSETFTKEG